MDQAANPPPPLGRLPALQSDGTLSSAEEGAPMNLLSPGINIEFHSDSKEDATPGLVEHL